MKLIFIDFHSILKSNKLTNTPVWNQISWMKFRLSSHKSAWQWSYRFRSIPIQTAKFPIFWVDQTNENEILNGSFSVLLFCDFLSFLFNEFLEQVNWETNTVESYKKKPDGSHKLILENLVENS